MSWPTHIISLCIDMLWVYYCKKEANLEDTSPVSTYTQESSYKGLEIFHHSFSGMWGKMDLSIAMSHELFSNIPIRNSSFLLH